MLAGKFADGSFAVDEIVEADRASQLGKWNLSGRGFASCSWYTFCFRSVSIFRQFVDDILRNVKAFDSEIFKVDFASSNAKGEESALPALNNQDNNASG